MGLLSLIVGATRSGKSRRALERGSALPGPRLFVATCPSPHGDDDPDLSERIARHRRDRDPHQWETVEEPLHPERVVADRADARVIVIDCLGLWVSNRMARAHEEGGRLGEEEMSSACQRLVAACREHPADVLVVSNEVGMGVVPANAVARDFCDILGRCNQTVASAAHQVTLMACGIALELKSSEGTHE